MNNNSIKNVHDLGAVIRSERKRLHVTQKELAMAVGTGLRFIIELEQGKETIRMGHVLKVMQALGIQLMLKLPDHPETTGMERKC